MYPSSDGENVSLILSENDKKHLENKSTYTCVLNCD